MNIKTGVFIRKVLSYCRWECKNAFVRETATLNIEENDLRFLVMQGKKISRWGSVSLPAGTIRDGLIVNPEALTAALNDLVATNRIRPGKVNISLSGVQTVHRIVELPRLPRRLLREAIISEAKKEMPISLDKMYLSWHNLSGKNEDVQRYFLLGVPQNVMDTEVRCLRKAHLAPRFLNIKAVALAKMINRSDALIIDIEPESSTIIVITGGVPLIMRRVAMSAGQSLEERARHVLQEFGRTLQFYESSHSGSPLKTDIPLYLTGWLADDQELYENIKAGSAYQVEKPAMTRLPQSGVPLAQYAVNLGLVRSGSVRLSVKKHLENKPSFFYNLDILPGVFRSELFPTKQIIFAVGIIIAIALLLPLNQITRDAVEAADERQAASSLLNRKVLLRQNQIKEAKQIEDAISGLKPVQQMIADVQREFQIVRESRTRSYQSLHYSIVEALPDRVELFSILAEAGKIKLAGQAPGYDTVMQYGNALRNTRGFSDVRILSLKRLNNIEDTVSFSISLRFE
jgi:type IV pilus assembly protein PilM